MLFGSVGLKSGVRRLVGIVPFPICACICYGRVSLLAFGRGVNLDRIVDQKRYCLCEGVEELGLEA